MTQQNSNIQPNSSDDEIDLIILMKKIWRGRKEVAKLTFGFMIIGLFIAIFSEKEYAASTTFLPQTAKSKIGGSIGGLAAMAGINLGNMGSDSEIPPTLYPQIINSISFQLELLKTPLTIEGEVGKISFQDYYTDIYRPGLFGVLKKYTIDLPGLIISTIKGRSGNVRIDKEDENQLIAITNVENNLIKRLNDQISIEVNDEDGSVTVSAIMPEPESSAELAYKLEVLLQQYLIDFKIQKSKEQLQFIKARYTEVEEKYKVAQLKLATEQDRNQYLSTSLARTSSQILEDEYNLVYGVYSELAKQLEAQYIQVTEDTPVFTVLNPVTIPVEKSRPNRPLILFVWTFMGGIIGAGMVLGKEHYKNLKNNWNEM